MLLTVPRRTKADCLCGVSAFWRRLQQTEGVRLWFTGLTENGYNADKRHRKFTKMRLTFTEISVILQIEQKEEIRIQ